jgi:oligopeptide/dipeptide ABC transporter ATP-binding protein
VISDEKLLDVRKLTVEYGTGGGTVTAVDNISFCVNKGEIFALVGESGSGKSTVAAAITRLVRAPGRITAGSILLKDRDLLKLSRREIEKVRGREIGMIFQNPLDSFNPVQRVGRQLAEAAELDKMPKKKARREAVRWLKEVRIPDAEQRARDYPFEYSGGMRQRAMIAMMSFRQPKLLIADEPTTALDVTIQAQILRLLHEEQIRLNNSILIITHDFGVVAEIADRVGIMYGGSIAEIGGVADVFEKPLHPYTRLLLAALPTITKHEGRLQSIPGSVRTDGEAQGCKFFSRCPDAHEECRKGVPVLTEVEEGHFCACVSKQGEAWKS